MGTSTRKSEDLDHSGDWHHLTLGTVLSWPVPCVQIPTEAQSPSFFNWGHLTKKWCNKNWATVKDWECANTQTQDVLALSDCTALSDFAATIGLYTTHAHFALYLPRRHSANHGPETPPPRFKIACCSSMNGAVSTVHQISSALYRNIILELPKQTFNTSLLL